jgi:hypothetical protein
MILEEELFIWELSTQDKHIECIKKATNQLPFFIPK